MLNYHFTWKLELKVQLRKVQQHIARARQSDKEEHFQDASAWLEHFIQHAAFDIRRLHESRHLSDSLWQQRIPVLQFARRPAPVPANGARDVLNLNEIYDLTKGDQAEIPFRLLCNDLIHSTILLDCVPAGEQTRLLGFVVTSAQFDHKLWHVELDHFFGCVERCCDDGWDKPPELTLPPLK